MTWRTKYGLYNHLLPSSSKIKPKLHLPRHFLRVNRGCFVRLVRSDTMMDLKRLANSLFQYHLNIIGTNRLLGLIIKVLLNVWRYGVKWTTPKLGLLQVYVSSSNITTCRRHQPTPLPSWHQYLSFRPNYIYWGIIPLTRFIPVERIVYLTMLFHNSTLYLCGNYWMTSRVICLWHQSQDTRLNSFLTTIFIHEPFNGLLVAIQYDYLFSNSRVG